MTLEIMAMVQERANGRPVYLFNACGALTEREERLCAGAGILCVPGISEYVDERQKEGYEVTLPNDGHWNEQGNKFAGEKLVEYFREAEILKGLTKDQQLGGGVGAAWCRSAMATLRLRPMTGIRGGSWVSNPRRIRSARIKRRRCNRVGVPGLAS